MRRGALGARPQKEGRWRGSSLAPWPTGGVAGGGASSREAEMAAQRDLKEGSRFEEVGLGLGEGFEARGGTAQRQAVAGDAPAV